MKRTTKWTLATVGFVAGLMTLLVWMWTLCGTLTANAAQRGAGQGAGSATTDGGKRMIRTSDSKGWRVLDPVTYENLTVFPIVMARGGVDTSGFLTLEEGLASGDVLVTERGSDVLRRTRDGRPVAQTYSGSASVNQLVLVNRSAKPLLLLAGEVVTGGKQDRVIAKDRIVPPGAEPLPLDVFCVEHGRWTGATGNFSASKLMAHPSVREKAAVDNNQQSVWDAVQNGSTSPAAKRANEAARAGGTATSQPAPAPALSQDALGRVFETEARTGSYAGLRNSPQVGQSVESFAAEIERRFAKAAEGARKDEMIIGVVIAYGGDLAWADAFASGRLFASYWPKLVRSYVVEALARPKTTEKTVLADAQEFLQPLTGRETIENEPGVYRWKQINEGRYAMIELEAVKPVGAVLHWVKIQRTT